MIDDLEAKITNLFKNSFIYGLGSIAQSGLNFILIPIMTFFLTQEEFGVYSLIMMSGLIASTIFYLGITSALPRSYFEYSDERKRKIIFSTGFIIIILGSIFQILVGYLFKNNISTLLFREILETEAIFWSLFAGSIGILIQYLLGFMRILKLAITSVFVNIMSLLLSLFLIISALYLYPESRILASFIALTISQFISFFIISLIIVSKHFVFRVDYLELKKLLVFGFATVFASAGYMFLEWSDRFIIERFMTISDVGLYSASVRIGSIINVLMIIPFVQIWSPMMMEYKDDKDIKDFFSRIMSYFTIVGLIFLIPGIIFSLELSSFLINIKDVNLNTLSVITSLFMISYFIYGFSNITTAGILYERKTHILPFIYIGFGILKFYLGILFVSNFGLIGLSFIAVLISTCLPITFYFFSRFYFSFNPQIKTIIKSIIIIFLLLLFKYYEFSNEVGFIYKMAMILFFYYFVYTNFLKTFEKRKIKIILKSKIF